MTQGRLPCLNHNVGPHDHGVKVFLPPLLGLVHVEGPADLIERVVANVATNNPNNVVEDSPSKSIHLIIAHANIFIPLNGIDDFRAVPVSTHFGAAFGLSAGMTRILKQ